MWKYFLKNIFFKGKDRENILHQNKQITINNYNKLQLWLDQFFWNMTHVISVLGNLVYIVGNIIWKIAQID